MAPWQKSSYCIEIGRSPAASWLIVEMRCAAILRLVKIVFCRLRPHGTDFQIIPWCRAHLSVANQQTRWPAGLQYEFKQTPDEQISADCHDQSDKPFLSALDERVEKN